MIEILFRGQNIAGEWHEGNLSVLKKKINGVDAGSYISNRSGMPFAYIARPETVGQLTPFIDCAGRKAYVGDKYLTSSDGVYIIFEKNGAFCGGVDFENAYPLGWECNNDEPDNIGESHEWFSNEAKIIGTIHD